MSSNAQGLQQRYPQRATCWRLRTRSLQFDRRPLLMGIVNVTPDSFSDGGKFLDPHDAIAHALQLAAQGADILDIGGESTRPYSDPVSIDEELGRVIPVIEGVSKQCELPISIDTSKSSVAEAAVAVGAEIINDVSGLTLDPKMIEVALETGAGICAMHRQGTPLTMQDDPRYEDVVSEIMSYLEQRRDALLAVGIAAERICLDPGIGFGKTHQHNLTLMAHCGEFHSLGCPLLVGHSRKGFLAKLLDDMQADRTAMQADRTAMQADRTAMQADLTAATIGGALALAAQGVQVIRVHDVRPVQEALLVFEAVGGIDGVPRLLAAES